ncbi:MAG: proteasome subunit alpha [Acidobacteria bacterium]|nr:proteasome subunit alpha [Acidobacteriota bacterium]
MAGMPYYVSPEQFMKDRADYARKGIARGKSIVAVTCAEGIVLVAENPSATLHKISELYDRIAFAAVGKYNEFENLRIAGVRLADMRGWSYDREDVTARSLANAYAQALGNIFTHEMKPFEVELLVAQVGATLESDEMYRVLYDGSVSDEQGFVAIGGQAENLTEAVRRGFSAGMSLEEALRLGARALVEADPKRTLEGRNLEAAMLDRGRLRRAFRRLSGDQVAAALPAG